MEIFKIVVLSLGGLMLCFAGAMRLLQPIRSYCLKLYADNPETVLQGEVDIFNEMRGAGTLTVFAGLIILLGTVLPEMRLTSFVVASLIFLGFAVGRLLSMALDGKPNRDLIQGFGFEVALGTLSTVGLVHILLS